MPTVAENREKWTVHDWVRDGHEWSPGGNRAGSDLLWWRTIVPRLHAHLPAGTLLEIAPGFGRWMTYLANHCARLIAVDVTERCVEICRQRFAGRPGADFHLNDGESLPMVADAAVDLAFSFDSLVHVEAPQVRAYIEELGRVLKPGGVGFIHHSNLGAYRESATGDIPPWIPKRHWRAASMSAAGFRSACSDARLRCATQEVINWLGRGARGDRHRLPGEEVPLTDCISVVLKPIGMAPDSPTLVHMNRRFVDEWREVAVMARMYGGVENGAAEQQTARVAAPVLKPQPASRTSSAGNSLPSRVRSYLSERRAGRRFRRNEPIVRTIAGGTCPDCGTRLSVGPEKFCSVCNVTFTVT